ncbi:hypothetical protein [Rhodoferax sp. GW822-FHT02A01]|uniref:hypothetical protein n=1 Tax=Rhodoferax sp. GW822-FHT02A01 TaxID=3141537 RepID=UPI00315CBC25
MANNNGWFRNPDEALTDLSNMLVSLDEQGKLPDDMREAIRMHADNCLDTIPLTIAATATALASSADGTQAISQDEVRNVAYGLAHMAEQMYGYGRLATHFRECKSMKVKYG